MTDSRTNHITVQSNSETETERIGEAMGSRIDRGLCICLVGSLGSGKSVMARGICRGLGVLETVISPSFILCEEYIGRLPVIHVDLYRLEHESEVEELGVLDRLAGEAVILAEWGDRSLQLAEAADIVVNLSVTGESGRTIEIDYGDGVRSIAKGLRP
jgi:tRNA threonylcarbamoyladenosine biosynthesis protein TsaE